MDEQPDIQAKIYLQWDRVDVDVHAVASGWCAVMSRRSPNKETPNEDAAVLIPTGPNSGVIAVADGCGGMVGGERASRLAIEMIRKTVEQATKTQAPVRSAILDGIEKANRDISDLGIGAATTVAVVEIEGETIRPYHVGDSTILLVGNHGKIKLQTTSHSPVGYAVEAGVLDEHEAIHHEDRHIVSNVMGTADTHIEIGPRRKMSSRDTLLVASDGLFDNLHLGEIVEISRKGPLSRAAVRLANSAAARMEDVGTDSPSKPDDLTFILFRRQRPSK